MLLRYSCRPCRLCTYCDCCYCGRRRRRRYRSRRRTWAVHSVISVCSLSLACVSVGCVCGTCSGLFSCSRFSARIARAASHLWLLRSLLVFTFGCVHASPDQLHPGSFVPAPSCATFLRRSRCDLPFFWLPFSILFSFSPSSLGSYQFSC